MDKYSFVTPAVAHSISSHPSFSSPLVFGEEKRKEESRILLEKSEMKRNFLSS